jgi:hypothetical protein
MTVSERPPRPISRAKCALLNPHHPTPRRNDNIHIKTNLVARYLDEATKAISPEPVQIPMG